MIIEEIICRGHQNITSKHKSTFEVTKDSDLSIKGDCIIGVSADKSCDDLSDDFKKALARDGSVLETTLKCAGFSCVINSKGSSKMTLSHKKDIVWRKSAFVCSRTIGIYSDKSAKDIPEELVYALSKGEEMTVILKVTPADEVL